MSCLKWSSFLGVLLLSAALAVSGQNSTVNFGTTYQTIRGYGASTAWTAVLTTAQANAAWGTSGNEIGLSINRARIDPGGSANWGTELSNAKLATARGAVEFATPWTPPASMKTNNNVVGGSLSTSSYAAYASYLESFVTYMANNGITLYGISMQNEPDFVPNYEGCGWTAQQMDTWVANNSFVLTTKLIMPESASFNFSQSDTTLNDPNAVGHVGIVAGHLYGATIQYYTNAENHGKEVWATEHYLTPASGGQPTIGDAIAAAEEVHNSMTVGYYNAYVWWWIAQNSGGANINYGLVDTNGSPTYYGFALGQFSRFVRPGSVRVSATNPASGVLVSAYKTSSGGSLVVINSNNNSESVTFNLQNLSAGSVTPYTTTASGGLVQQSAVTVSNNSFSYTLPAQSIVTFATSGSGGSCSTTPSTPGGLTATAASSSGINLSWNTVTPPTNCSISYNVYRSTMSGFTPSSSNQVGSASGTTFGDAGLNASTTYYYKVEAVDSAGSSAASTQASATTQSSGGNTISIDAGGGASGSWVADEDFSGGTALTYTNSVSTARLSGAIPPQTVLQSQRYGNGTAFTYTIPGYTAGSSHTIALYFAENYVTGSGKREFNVIINGTQVLTNYDVFAAAGGQFIAVEQSFSTKANSNGQIVIQFTPGAVQNPMVTGISIQ